MRKAMIVAAVLAVAPMIPAFAQQGPVQPGAQYFQGQPRGPEVPLFLGPAVIRDVQSELSRMGYNPGTINGAWNPQTASALQAFQHSSGLEPTGNLDVETLHTLGVPRRLLESMLTGAEPGGYMAGQGFGGQRYGYGQGYGFGAAPQGAPQRFGYQYGPQGGRFGQGPVGAFGGQPTGGTFGPSQGGPGMQTR